jgi:catechol 2,3-dioxygenase-like lactoylglutathione lyase family enzyme
MVNHVGLTVADLEASTTFYRDVVGMELVRQYPVAGDDWFRTLTENEDAVVQAVMLRLGSFQLQLVQYHAGGGSGATGHHVEGGLHLCVDVDDVDAVRASIEATGRCHVGPTVRRDPYGGRSFYVHDPDGVPVEFQQQDG